MKKVLLLFLLLMFLPSSAWAGGFRPVASMDTARLEPAVATLQDTSVLVAGGHTGPDGATRSAEIYDPALRVWRKTGSLRTPRTGATATTLPDGRVLVVGGQRGRSVSWSPLASAEIFDPSSGTFQQLSARPLARSYGAATLLANGTVLLWGGKGSLGTEPVSQIFNPASGTFQNAGLPRPTLLGGSVNVVTPSGAMRIGGYKPGAASRSSAVWSSGWRNTASLRRARADAAGVILGSGSVLVAGGTARGKTLRSTEVFRNGRWSLSRSLRNPRLGAEMVLVGGRPMLLSGWIGGRATDRTEVLYRGGWRPGPRTMWPRWGATTQALPGNSLLVLGGVSLRGLLRGTRRSVEIYDPMLRAPWARIMRGPAKKTSKRFAQFVFRAQDKKSFEYRLDSGRWKKSGTKLRLRKLSSGKHTLRVRTRVFKLRSPSAVWRWTVR